MSSSSLDHNKTEFKTKSDERTTHEFSTLASGSSLTTTEFISQQSNKIRNDLKSESNFNNNLHSNSTLIPNTTTTDESTTSAAITTATARPHSKSRKFRGKRKKIKKRFNKKNKLKYDLEETEENVEEKIENNYNSNKNHKNNNQKNKKFYNIKRKNRIHEIELEANIENPYSSIELLSESSSSTAADADALALNQHETKKSLVFKNKKLRKSQHRTQRKNQKKRNKEHLHHRWNDDDILDNHHDQYYYTNTERRTKLSNSNSKSRNSNINTDNIRKNSNNSRNKFNYNTTTTITSLSPTSIDFKSHQKNNRKMQIDSLYNDFNSQIHSHQSHHHPKKLHHNQYNNQKRYQQNHFQHHNQQNIVDNNPRDKVNAFNLINYNNLNNNDNDEDININDDIIDDDDDDYDDDIDNDDDGLQHQRKRTKTKFKDIINIDIDADIIDETNENIHDNNDDNMDDDNNNDDDDDDVYYNPEIIDETKSMQINKNLRNFKTKNNKNYNKYNKKNINYNKNEMKNLRRDAGKLLEKKQRKEKKFQNRYERGGDEKHQQKYNQKNYKKTENRNLDYVDEKQQSDWQQYHEHQQKLSKNEKNQNQDNFKDIQFSKDNLIELSSRPSSFLMIKSAHKKISLDNGNMQDDDDNTDSNDSSDDDNNDGYIDNIDSFDISASADESNQNSNEKSVNLNTNDGIQNHIYSIRNQKQKQQQRLKLQQQQQQQQQQFKQSKPIDDINQSVVSTLNHYSIQSQEEQLMTMMEKTNPRQKLNNINQQKSPTSTFQSQSQSQSQSSSSSSGYQTSNTTSTEQNKEQKNYWNVIGLNRLTTNNNDFTNTNTVNQSQNNFADESNSNSNGIEKKFYMNVNKDDRNNLHNRKNGNDESYNISGGGGGSSSSSTGISNGNSISENLSQEDFITSKHSVEKLMEITSIEKDIDENETGDLSCFQDDDFQPAPEIPHADIKYLRNEEKGFENSFLEVEYICHHGYELQIANTDDINSNEKHRNVFCKNNNWIGTPPFCVKMVKDNNNNSNNKNGRNQQGIDERNQSKSNRTCNNPEKCEHLCVVENDIEKCVCHKGFKLNNKHCEDINECVSRNGHGPCQDVCINTWGSYKCSCDNIPGSHLNTDGHTCMEIDECSQNNGGCSHTCIHTMGRAYCLCPEGYTLDKDWKTCVDIDECAEQASDDSSELRCEFGCINTPGSYTCLVDFGAEQSIYEESLTECADGFYHNSSTADCEDINECSEKNGGCLHRCINTFGSFYCSCLPGYHIDSDMKACIAAPTLNNKNLMNGIDVSCPPLFPPKHGYLECSRPLSENDNNNNNSDNDNSNIMTETNGDGNSHNNNKNTTENRNENSQINVENSNSNSGKNVSILDDVKNKEQQQQQLQQEQQSHLTTNRPGSQCVLRCPTGFRINGNFSKQCNTNGKWIGDSDGTCIRYPTPKLICPTDITLETPPNEKMAKLKIPRPRTDVNFDRDVSVTPEFLKTSSDIAFEIGTRNVTYTAKNPVSKLSISCSFTISVVEGESPTVKYCPGTQKYSLEKQHDSIKVIWKEPIFQDNINVTEISKTNTPGNNFGIGTHQIVYIAKDEAGYSARCIFKIIVNVPPQDVLIHPLPFYRMFYKK